MKFDFDKDFELHIEVDKAEAWQLLTEYSKVNNIAEPMVRWFDRPDVPQDKKDKYGHMLKNALRTMAFLTNLLKACGISDKEIEDALNIPF